MSLIGPVFFGLYWAVFVYSVVLHEIAHGWSSLRLGDPTALKAGRLTLNPVSHIDPIKSILMPIVFFVMTGIPFGGAKPVPINPYLYRNLRWGSLISAAAGPVTNLLLALLFAIGLNLSRIAARLGPGELDKLPLTGQFLAACMLTNLFLAVFNFLPIPPLDGSHVLASLLPRGAREAFGRVQGAGFMPIMVAVLLDSLLRRQLGFSVIGYLMIHPTYWLLKVMQVVGDQQDLWKLLESLMAMKLLKGG